jgi:hypothetical protein
MLEHNYRAEERITLCDKMRTSSMIQHVVQCNLNGYIRGSKPQDSITYGAGVNFPTIDIR